MRRMPLGIQNANPEITYGSLYVCDLICMCARVTGYIRILSYVNTSTDTKLCVCTHTITYTH
eukprot:m.65428 g.65428  ORF g.65428 m.65428 type:complete len:62 (-) comp23556_c1_seq1:119-304(-)